MATRLTTVELIWEKVFLCRIPDLATQSDDYIKIFGIPTCGISSIDDELKKAFITTEITINDMVEHFKNDVQIYLVNPADSKEIYDIITEYLITWRNQLERGLNTANAPIEDLLALDSFANAVYDHAVHHFDRKVYTSLLEKTMTGSSLFNPSNLFKTKSPPKRIVYASDEPNEGMVALNPKEEDENAIPPRESFADTFQIRLMSGVRKWG